MNNPFRDDDSPIVSLESPFYTTIQNEMFEWLAKIAIYPAYVVCVLSLNDWMFSNHWRIIGTLLVILSFLPLVPPLLIWNAWPMGFRKTELGYFAGIFILMGYFHRQPERTLSVFWIILCLIWAVFLLRRIWNRRRFFSYNLAILVVLAFVISAYLAWMIWSLEPIPVWGQFSISVVVILCASIFPLLQMVSYFQLIRRKPAFYQYSRKVLMSLGWGLLFVLVYLLIRFRDFTPFTSLIALGILILALSPAELLSRFRARWRALVQDQGTF